MGSQKISEEGRTRELQRKRGPPEGNRLRKGRKVK